RLDETQVVAVISLRPHRRRFGASVPGGGLGRLSKRIDDDGVGAMLFELGVFGETAWLLIPAVKGEYDRQIGNATFTRAGNSELPLHAVDRYLVGAARDGGSDECKQGK